MQKEIFIQLLEQRAYKQTSDQFWAVAIMTGFYGVLIFKYTEIIVFLNPIEVIILSVIAACVGSLYICHRHRTYINVRKETRSLTENISDAPSYLKNVPGWGGHSFLGWGFYTLIIWVGCIATILRYI